MCIHMKYPYVLKYNTPLHVQNILQNTNETHEVMPFSYITWKIIHMHTEMSQIEYNCIPGQH